MQSHAAFRIARGRLSAYLSAARARSNNAAIGGTNVYRPTCPTRSATQARSSRAANAGACRCPQSRHTTSPVLLMNKRGPTADLAALPHRPQVLFVVDRHWMLKFAMRVGSERGRRLSPRKSTIDRGTGKTRIRGCSFCQSASAVGAFSRCPRQSCVALAS
jgi:hypothetical protein